MLSHAGERSTVLLSTHQNEDVAALCDRVVVLDHGRVRYHGPVIDPVATAAGRVWLADADPGPAPRGARGPGAAATWRRPPRRGAATQPTLEDAYLLLLGEASLTRAWTHEYRSRAPGSSHTGGDGADPRTVEPRRYARHPLVLTGAG